MASARTTIAIVCVPAGLLQSWRAGRKQGRSLLRTGGRWLEATVLWSLVAYVLFIALWGAGYRRFSTKLRGTFDEVLSKPVDCDRLLDGVSRLAQ